MSDPLVSVILITYQHEAFITQAVQSVLAQKTEFDIELLISEDCSSDRTREIVQDLQRRFPAQIRLFLSEHNQNNNDVQMRAWQAARGKYIAILDGDDYWTDPLKLQKQVRFLEKNPHIFICGHNVTVVDEENRVLKERKFEIFEDRYLSPEDLALHTYFPTLSVLFRNNKVMPSRNVFIDVFNADTFTFRYFANFGGGYMSREIMGAYRVHGGGVWSQIDAHTAIDHRNKTLSKLPLVLDAELRSIAYFGLLWHSIGEDYSWGRKVRNIPYASMMMILWLRPRSLSYLFKKVISRMRR